MSLRRYQLTEPRGQGAGTPRSEGRGSVPHLLEENLSDCFAGTRSASLGKNFFFFFFLNSSWAKSTVLILRLALELGISRAERMLQPFSFQINQ